MSSNHQPDFTHHAPEDMHEPISPHVQAQQRMEEARFAFFPASLRGRFPEIWILALENNNVRLIQTLLFILAYITLFATVIGQPHRTEAISILMSFLAPLSFTIWYILFPLNPYETYFFTRQGLANLDEKDDVAREFVSVLSSPQAGAFLWKRSQRLWLYFALPMVVMVLGLHRLPAIAAGASWLVRVPLFFFFVFCLFRLEMLRWAVGVVKSNE
ncbi:MAG: hypothetical protein ACP5M4_06595 [Acidobacteriaceae bacterium]